MQTARTCGKLMRNSDTIIFKIQSSLEKSSFRDDDRSTNENRMPHEIPISQTQFLNHRQFTDFHFLCVIKKNAFTKNCFLMHSQKLIKIKSELS